MQSLHETYYGSDEVYDEKHYKLVKYMQNHNKDNERQYWQNQSSFNNSRSMTSTFRHSIRHLTSCASVR